MCRFPPSREVGGGTARDKRTERSSLMITRIAFATPITLLLLVCFYPSAQAHPADQAQPAETDVIPGVWGLWPPDQWENVTKIIDCESEWNPDAIGKAGEIGLTQIHWDNLYGREYPVGLRAKLGLSPSVSRQEIVGWLKVPHNNLRAAYWTWKLRGERWGGHGGWACARIQGISP